MKNPLISACIITRNEEARIDRCLESLKWVDEIVVVDSVSTDETVRIARKHGARVELRPFTNYAEQKNHAAALANGEWVLSIDADEVVTPALKDEIKLILRGPLAEGYRLKRRSHIFGREFRYTGTQHDAPIRLFRKNRGRFEGSIHETVQLNGKAAELRNVLEHYTYDNLHQYMERFNRYTTAEAKRFVAEHKKCSRKALWLKPPAIFIKLYVLQQGFRDGFQGFVFSVLSAYYAFVKHAKHAELLGPAAGPAAGFAPSVLGGTLRANGAPHPASPAAGQTTLNPRVVLVVLNWNLPGDTIECVESCQKIQYENFEILIVDNGSKDSSVKQFRERFSSIEIIANPENLGYAGGNNVGMKRALEKGADWVLLLNNDTTLEPDMLKELVAAAQRHPEAGMLAPKVLYYDDRQVINSLGTSMDWLRHRPFLGDCNKPDGDAWPATLDRDILVGCGLMVRRDVIEAVGMIDEAFFIFHEEADWCFRTARAGFKTLVVRKAAMYHKASKTMREFSALTHYYSSRNFLRLAERNARPADRVKVAAGLVFLILKHAARWLGGDRKLPRAFFLGIYDYFAGNLGKCRRSFVEK